MKKWLLFLVMGVVLGFYVYPKFFNTTLSSTGSKDVATNAAAPEATPVIQKTLKTDGGTIVVTKLGGSSEPEEESEDFVPPTHANVKERVDQSMGLHLEEPVIEHLEENQDRIRHSVYTVQEEGGWRVHAAQDSEFLKLGFQDGDLITNESLEMQMANPERAELAGRFVALLANLQRHQ